MSLNHVRTKVKKTERIELRVSKAFKKSLEEMSVQNNMTMSRMIELFCTEKISEYYGDSVSTSLPLKSKKSPSCSDFKGGRASYEREIWRMLQSGMTPTQSAEWLNENGYKPQRGEKFTLNSVHSIRRRLKRENR